MRTRRPCPSNPLIAAAALAVALAACTGSAATTTVATTVVGSSTTSSSTTSTSSTTTSTTTTITTTTTTTLPPTTTTTTLPPAVLGWEGAGVGAVSVVIEFDPPIAALDMRAVVRSSLAAIGITTDDDAEAVLLLELDGSPVSRSYQDLGRCYSGAKVSGTAKLIAPDLPAKEIRLSWNHPAPMVIFSSDCETDPEYAPYEVAFATAFVPVLPAFWGAASAPALIEIIAAPIRNSQEDYPLKAAAMDAFRGLDPDLIDPHEIAACLSATIDMVEELTEGYTPHGLDVAARRLLTEYSGTNFGVATMDDVAEWREWLAAWEEEHTP